MGSNAGGLSPIGVESLIEFLSGSDEANVLGITGKAETEWSNQAWEHTAELVKSEAEAGGSNSVLNGGDNSLLNKGSDLKDGGKNCCDGGTSH